MLRKTLLVLALMFVSGQASAANWSAPCNLSFIGTSTQVVLAKYENACWFMGPSDTAPTDSPVFEFRGVRSGVVMLNPNVAATTLDGVIDIYKCIGDTSAPSVNTCSVIATLDGTPGDNKLASFRVGPGWYYLRVTTVCSVSCAVEIRAEGP